MDNEKYTIFNPPDKPSDRIEETKKETKKNTKTTNKISSDMIMMAYFFIINCIRTITLSTISIFFMQYYYIIFIHLC